MRSARPSRTLRQWVEKALREADGVGRAAHLQRPSSLRLAAVGVRAAESLSSRVLRERLAYYGFEPTSLKSLSAPNELLREDDWDVALVLSPFKMSTLPLCNTLSRTARTVGAVDTVLRVDRKTLGFNTNLFGIGANLVRIEAQIGRLYALVLGTGGTARATVGAIRDFCSGASVVVIGRSLEKAENVASSLDFGVPAASVPSQEFNVIINTTSVGEVDDEETIAFDLSGVMQQAPYFLDLNIRFSQLQRDALESGLTISSGALIQYLVHHLRAYLCAWIRHSCADTITLG